MIPLKLDDNPSSYDFWDVNKAASGLSNQACTLSARYIQDGTLRALFNRDFAYYAQSIVKDVEQGRKTPEQGMAEIQKEQRSLFDLAKEIAMKGIGVVAGGMQVAAGGAVCTASAATAGLLCVTVGAPLAAHGANNIYENGRNLWEGRSDTQGPVRKAYHSVAQAMGGNESDGNVAYGAVDLGTSAYGLFRQVLKPGSWRLFRYVQADYVRGYKNVGGTALAVETAANIYTIKNMSIKAKNNGQ